MWAPRKFVAPGGCNLYNGQNGPVGVQSQTDHSKTSGAQESAFKTLPGNSYANNT